VIFNALLLADLVDELFLTISPMLVGGTEPGITAGPALTTLRTMRLAWVLEHEGHLFLRYIKPPPQEPAKERPSFLPRAAAD
jgi:riboflavin biosynthesis pyrimidine reductase